MMFKKRAKRSPEIALLMMKAPEKARAIEKRGLRKDRGA